MQDSDTSKLYFSVAEIIAEITLAFELLPGDYIATGTPAGVGFFRKPPVWMKAGDVCEISIEGIGTLSNPVENE